MLPTLKDRARNKRFPVANLRFPLAGRGKTGGKTMYDDQTSFSVYPKKIRLDKTAALFAHHICALLADELQDAFTETRKQENLNTYDDLIERAQPYWYKASREKT